MEIETTFEKANCQKNTYLSWFILIAVALLITTGAAKVWSAFGNMKVLAVPDPVTGLALGRLMFVAGIIELLAAVICVLNKSECLRLGIIAWLASNFLIYRTSLAWVGWHKPCSCLGNLIDALHIPPQVADTAMKIILAYLLIGSYGCLFWLWRQRKKTVAATPAQ